MRNRNPFLRLLGVVGLVAFLISIGVTFLRWIGEHDVTPENPHVWMKKSFWRMARLDPHNCTSGGLTDLLKIDEDWIVWLDVTPDANEKWHVICPETKVFELKKGPTLGPDLADVVPLTQNRGVIFNVHAPDSSFADGFLKQLGNYAEKKSDVGVASPSQSLVRELRKKEPQWLFAADSTTWTKLKFLESFGLERITDLWADFYLTSLDSSDPNYFDLGAAREIGRRNKVLVLLLDDSSALKAEALDFQSRRTIRGVLTTRPKTFSADAFLKNGVAE